MIINLAKIRFGGSGGGNSPAKPEDFFQETYTANGNYDVAPQAGHVFSGGTITVAVPSDQKPEETLTQTYTANGNYDVVPEEGHVFSGGTITVAVPGGQKPEETLTQTITANGTQTFTPTAGSVFDSAVITVNVPSGTFVVPDGIKFSNSSVSSFPSDWDWSNVHDWYQMFSNCTNLTTVPDIDLSGAFALDSLFSYCSSLISIPPLSLDNVGQMGGMFQGCSSLATFPTLDLSNSPSNSIYASSLFSDCSSLVSVPNCDFSKFGDAGGLFSSCTSLTTVGDLNFAEASCSQLFYYCTSLTTVGTLNTQNSTNMYGIFEMCTNLTSVAGIDFSSLTSSPGGYFEYSDYSKLTHFIVNGVINWSWSSDEQNGGFFHTPNLDFASIKSILEAMNRTTNTDAKKMSFNNTIFDQNGELTALVASCATKGWTITGLNILEKPLINSITPNKEHITASEINQPENITLTINANYAWSGGGIPRSHQSSGSYIGYQYDYYDANTDEFVRSGYESQSAVGVWRPTSGSSGETIIKGDYNNHQINPQSGEYAKVGITFRSNSSPYEYVDYYFKVYPDGE